MNILYIIGNGFDMCHDLHTSYNNFKNYLAINDKNLSDYLEKYFPGSLWSDFENSLGKLNINKIITENLPYIADDEIKEQGRDIYAMADSITWQTEELVGGLKKNLNDWILDTTRVAVRPRMPLDNNATFMTFNYSHTLENCYSIDRKKVLHIHGEAIEYSHQVKFFSKKNKSEIIIGHSRHTGIGWVVRPKLKGNKVNANLVIDEGIRAIENLDRELFKNSGRIIEGYKWFFSSLKKIDKIIVIGHSLSNVDLPYFSAVECAVPKDSQWLFTYYPINTLPFMSKQVSRIIHPNKRVSFINMETDGSEKLLT